MPTRTGLLLGCRWYLSLLLRRSQYLQVQVLGRQPSAGSRQKPLSNKGYRVGAWRSGSAPALGAGGRWFESSRPDHRKSDLDILNTS